MFAPLDLHQYANIKEPYFGKETLVHLTDQWSSFNYAQFMVFA